MKRLILTSSSGLDLMRAGLAEVAIAFVFRFVWGPLPSPDELATYVAARSDKHGPGEHWSDFAGRWPRDAKGRKHLSLVEFCQAYEVVELWFDPGPNDQLLLIWLLDYFRSHPETVAKSRLRLVDFALIGLPPEGLGRWKVPAVDLTEVELLTAQLAWQAYRATTPEACFGLLGRNLSALPLLRPALLDLLEELPSSATGLGATEMRFLELVARGYTRTNALFHLRTLRHTRVFNELELGWLLRTRARSDARGGGWLDELRTICRENLRDRHAAYLRSRLSLTEFGKAVLAHHEDFGLHNPIHRWWGGTELTSDRLWRWNPMLMKPRLDQGRNGLR